MSNLITTDTRAASFDPSKSYGHDWTFVVTSDNQNVVQADIAKMKAMVESNYCEFIPAHFRKYIKRYLHMVEPPKESSIGWRYEPPVEVKCKTKKGR